MNGEQKVSQMILDVAAQFIELGSSEEERQTHLYIACKAWNISILPKSKRNKEYNKYLNEIGKYSAEPHHVRKTGRQAAICGGCGEGFGALAGCRVLRRARPGFSQPLGLLLHAP